MKKDSDGGLPSGGKKDGSLHKGLTGRSVPFEDGSGHKGGPSVDSGLVRGGTGTDVPQLGPRSA